MARCKTRASRLIKRSKGLPPILPKGKPTPKSSLILYLRYLKWWPERGIYENTTPTLLFGLSEFIPYGNNAGLWGRIQHRSVSNSYNSCSTRSGVNNLHRWQAPKKPTATPPKTNKCHLFKGPSWRGMPSSNHYFFPANMFVFGGVWQN